MSTEKNKAILRQFLEAWNPREGGDWKVCAEDCIFHGVAGEMSVERMQQVSSLYFGAFPDLLGTIEDLVAEGDKVSGFSVISIDPSSVTLSFGGNEFELELK